MPYKDSEKKREAKRRRYAANPEKQREAARRWQAANPEKKREAARRWQAANPERAREAKRRWRAANPEKKYREVRRRYYVRTLEKLDEFGKLLGERLSSRVDTGQSQSPSTVETSGRT